MKYTSDILLILFLLSCIPSFSQTCMENGDMEQWAGQSNPIYWEEPIGWSTSNRFTGNMGCGGGPGVMSDTQAHHGQFSARLMSLEYGFAAVPYPGYIINGEGLDIDINGFWNFDGSGQPCTATPVSLSGYYTYANWYPEDSAWIEIILTHYNTTNQERDTVAYGHQRLGIADTFTHFEVFLNYPFSHPEPDTLVIFIASTDPYNPMAGGVLKVDQLSIGDSGGIPEPQDESIIAFPNPSHDRIYLRNDSETPVSLQEVKVFTLDGKLFMEKKEIDGTFSPNFDISNWEPSIYIFQCLDDSGKAFNLRIVKI